MVTEHELPLVLKVAMSWDQLQPPLEVDETLGLPVKATYGRGDIKRLLGISDWMLVDRIQRGIIPEAQTWRGGKRVWTAEEVRELVQVSALRSAGSTEGTSSGRYPAGAG